MSEQVAEREVYVVQGPGGFTETFNERTVQTLVNLGLIQHDRDGHVLEDGQGRGVGALHHFYVQAHPVTPRPSPGLSARRGSVGL